MTILAPINFSESFTNHGLAPSDPWSAPAREKTPGEIISNAYAVIGAAMAIGDTKCWATVNPGHAECARDGGPPAPPRGVGEDIANGRVYQTFHKDTAGNPAPPQSAGEKIANEMITGGTRTMILNPDPSLVAVVVSPTTEIMPTLRAAVARLIDAALAAERKACLDELMKVCARIPTKDAYGKGWTTACSEADRAIRART